MKKDWWAWPFNQGFTEQGQATQSRWPWPPRHISFTVIGSEVDQYWDALWLGLHMLTLGLVHGNKWNKHNWLVVDLPLSKMMEFVSWDDEIPNIWKIHENPKKCSKPPIRKLILHWRMDNSHTNFALGLPSSIPPRIPLLVQLVLQLRPHFLQLPWDGDEDRYWQPFHNRFQVPPRVGSN